MTASSGGRAVLSSPGRPTTYADKRISQSNDIAPVWAVAYPPAGLRQRWLLVVLRCSECCGSHGHYTGSTGGIRRRGCGRGSYLVRPRPMLGVAA